MKNWFFVFLLIPVLGACQIKSEQMVLLKIKEDPTISFRLLFKVGSQNDPQGKEGLAALTAEMISDAGSAEDSYEEVLAKLYPMAAGIGSSVDKEMTVISGRTHKDNLAAYYQLLSNALLKPAFAEKDFARIKDNTLSYLKKNLRYSQDEELGKEVLSSFIFEGTPYAHPEEGLVSSVESITLEDVRDFYKTNYTRANLMVGLAGGFDDNLVEKLEKDLASLPQGTPSAVPAPQPTPLKGTSVKIVSKGAPATAISFGFPINALRGDRDFYALALATSWLGEHRNSFSHLYQVIRETRGLNYGDYAYVEHFPNGGRRQFPPPNVARRRAIFQIWIRPVPNEAKVFAFRAALRELQHLVDRGMSAEDFEMTRKFLRNYNLHYAPTTMMKLGYAMDDRFYGIKDGHWKRYAEMLDELTLEDVNAALRKHFSYQNLKAVFITDASQVEELKATLIGNTPSPISYSSPKPEEVLDEDKVISTFPLSISAGDITVEEVDTVFQ
ncbi:MAG TPA: pitrilysin family protein [Calditrichia bacterium]|nr:pitrilysin family protein [Calditrichia bacterium]